MNDHIAKIRDIAQDVYNKLGSGFSEDVYDRCYASWSSTS